MKNYIKSVLLLLSALGMVDDIRPLEIMLNTISKITDIKEFISMFVSKEQPHTESCCTDKPLSLDNGVRIEQNALSRYRNTVDENYYRSRPEEWEAVNSEIQDALNRLRMARISAT